MFSKNAFMYMPHSLGLVPKILDTVDIVFLVSETF